MHSEYKAVKRIKCVSAFVCLEAQTLPEPTSEVKYLSKTRNNVVNKTVREETDEICVQMLNENT